MQPRHHALNGKPQSKPLALYDTWLISAVLALIVIGIMMVSSSSVMISTKYFHTPFHFLIRHIIYLGIGFIVMLAVIRIDTRYWEKASPALLMLSLVMLALVLIPGLGKSVNGARRWIGLAGVGIQVSELVKLTMVLYLSGYIVRQRESIQHDVASFIKPMFILAIVALLLIKEPDFGATVVITMTVLTMLFLSGVKFRYYLTLLASVVTALAFIAIASPYRVKRLTSFLNPWADQFNTGYQLTQSLIAFGRGGYWGVGLGESIQKLLYLPEAHTDFIFAVLAEETGLIGIILVLCLYAILIFRGFMTGYTAFRQTRYFAAYTGYGITCWLCFQAIINMGVNLGLLPTKGLTLPFLSYGGASIILNCFAVALILRIDHENRRHALGFTQT